MASRRPVRQHQLRERPTWQPQERVASLGSKERFSLRDGALKVRSVFPAANIYLSNWRKQRRNPPCMETRHPAQAVQRARFGRSIWNPSGRAGRDSYARGRVSTQAARTSISSGSGLLDPARAYPRIAEIIFSHARPSVMPIFSMISTESILEARRETSCLRWTSSVLEMLTVRACSRRGFRRRRARVGFRQDHCPERDWRCALRRRAVSP